MARTQQAAKGSGNGILAWEDDPLSLTGVTPIDRPTPDLAAKPLAITIDFAGRAPAPKAYKVDTPEFRYWAAGEAVRRAADFWGAVLPAGTGWQVGAALPIHLDQGVDLNAFYTRGGGGDPAGLSFFHATVDGTTAYSGESPDVVCHETGHAILDALRPQLWDAMSAEVAAFHESFGDMSAILSQLQIQSLRQAVLTETAGKLYRSSRLSRLAEQLGWAIRQSAPDAVEPDCLRNAVNSFFYQDPQALPPSAPAAQLSSEPHSFSRVFTGAFFEVLAGMLAIVSQAPTEANLQQVSQDAAHILIDGIIAAPVSPDYFSQVAAHMIDAETRRFNGKYRDALKGAFVHHGILSLPSTVAMANLQAVPAGPNPTGELPLIGLSAARYGLGDRPLLVRAAAEPKRFQVAAAAPDLGSVVPPSHDKAAQSFLEDLFRRGNVDLAGQGDTGVRIAHPLTRKTHRLIESGNQLMVVRRIVNCGLD